MYVKTVTLTFAGGGAQTLIAAFGTTRATRLHVEPADANVNVCYIGGPTFVMATSTVDGVIRQLAIPDTTHKQPLDSFDVDISMGKDMIELDQYLFDGTAGQKVRVTILVG